MSIMMEFGVAFGLALAVYTLWELYHREMTFGRKTLWTIGIICFMPFGSMLYFLVVIHPIFHNHDRRM
jgi:hypothetical protein